MNIRINENFKNINQSYLFSEIARRVNSYSTENPLAKVIRLGIGDVTLPLPASVINAMRAAVDEMADQATFRGYSPEHGYDFVREAVVRHYSRFSVSVSQDEIFVSDGAKSDIGNIVDILGNNRILIPDPVYPVYVDSNVMSGRKISYIPAGEENGFLPMPSEIDGDADGSVVYMCSPNNPTGAVYSAEQLAEWVAFAKKTGSLIIFDSAYEAFIGEEKNLPHTIYEIPGAKECAIEICSLSKTAGFTGTRCGWTVVPAELEASGLKLSAMWERRQATKFNGVPYVIQRAAEAALGDEGRQECMENINYYMKNAEMISSLMREKGIFFTGGENSPYIWLKCPNGMDSWKFFDYLLGEANVVGTPGAGFGKCGEGYFRLTSFGDRESTAEAVERLRKLL